jgi:hypothetical protein
LTQQKKDKQHDTSNTLITPAAYARMRGLNRSTISRQIKTGAIKTCNGLLDPIEADRDRKNNVDSSKRRNKPAPEDLAINSMLAPEETAPACYSSVEALVIGSGYFASILRDEVRVNALADLLTEAGTISPAEARRLTVLAIYIINLWAMSLIENEFGKKSGKAFNRGISEWFENLPKHQGRARK